MRLTYFIIILSFSTNCSGQTDTNLQTYKNALAYLKASNEFVSLLKEIDAKVKDYPRMMVSQDVLPFEPTLFEGEIMEFTNSSTYDSLLKKQIEKFVLLRDSLSRTQNRHKELVEHLIKKEPDISLINDSNSSNVIVFFSEIDDNMMIGRVFPIAQGNENCYRKRKIDDYLCYYENFNPFLLLLFLFDEEGNITKHRFNIAEP